MRFYKLLNRIIFKKEIAVKLYIITLVLEHYLQCLNLCIDLHAFLCRYQGHEVLCIPMSVYQDHEVLCIPMSVYQEHEVLCIPMSVCTSCIWCLLINLSSPKANHLKFILMVSDYKRKANFNS